MTEVQQAKATPDSNRIRLWLCALAVAMFLALAAGNAWTRLPLADEAYYASAAYNLISSGVMGITVQEPASSPFVAQDRYTYAYPPMHILSQAAWYEVAGFGLHRMRLLSVFWGLMGLVSWFVIVWKLIDARAAIVAFGFLAVDYTFVMSAALGRPDMMAAALGFAGWAAYLWFRETSLAAGLVAGHALVVASGLTHPLGGVLALTGMTVLVITLDRHRLRLRHAIFVAIPYLIGAVGWGMYILQAPAIFKAQFVTGLTQGKRFGFGGAGNVLLQEIGRYAGYYGIGAGKIDARALLLALYLAGIAGALLLPGIRRRRGYRVLIMVGALEIAAMALLEGSRQRPYIVYVMPIATVLLAGCVSGGWSGRRRWAYAIAALFLVLHAGMLAYRVSLRQYQKTYIPLCAAIRAAHQDHELITGTMSVAFGVGFDQNVVQDWAVGYFSRKRPGMIVIDSDFRRILQAIPTVNRDIDRYVHQLMAQYRQAFALGDYEVYVPL